MIFDFLFTKLIQEFFLVSSNVYKVKYFKQKKLAN